METNQIEMSETLTVKGFKPERMKKIEQAANKVDRSKASFVRHYLGRAAQEVLDDSE